MISWLGSVSNTETACPKWGLLPQPRPRAAGRPGRGPELGPTLRVKAVGARPLASHLLPARCDSRRLSLDPSPHSLAANVPRTLGGQANHATHAPGQRGHVTWLGQSGACPGIFSAGAGEWGGLFFPWIWLPGYNKSGQWPHPQPLGRAQKKMAPSPSMG